EKESIIEGLRAGASDYVTKPFNIDELLARVNAQIQNIRLRKEIMKMNQNLHENILARDRLLSIIGHDLKSPLGSLLGLAQFYLENGRDDLQSLIEFPPIVNKSLTGILNLLANLLSWARLQGGHMKPDPRKVNLLDALQSSIEILEPQASQKGIEISFLNKADEAIIMDANMLETVIRNLVSNAVKFTKNGGKIEINYSRQNGNVELSVRDNGVGMKPEVLENLFKIDVRQQSQGTNKETGTGLGLVLCRDMIIKNEGSIRVESKSGEGTVFFVTFKAAS
ncbi:MAG: hybrid sensor histidine kinase/response regulator, partial [Spirochaetia bacterium]|nr:hybrid sensor histidine kinase/response regulator [Spirochaetia bacterium]